MDQDCHDPVPWERPANGDLVLCRLQLDAKLGLLFHVQSAVPFEQLASISVRQFPQLLKLANDLDCEVFIICTNRGHP